MSAGCQNYTPLKQTNKTSYASWIWDGGYEWVKVDRKCIKKRSGHQIRGVVSHAGGSIGILFGGPVSASKHYQTRVDAEGFQKKKRRVIPMPLTRHVNIPVL